jgi:hypothetical protein
MLQFNTNHLYKKPVNRRGKAAAVTVKEPRKAVPMWYSISLRTEWRTAVTGTWDLSLIKVGKNWLYANKQIILCKKLTLAKNGQPVSQIV